MVLAFTALVIFPCNAIAQSTAPVYNQARTKSLTVNARVRAEGPFQPNWSSLKNYKISDWYQNAKFGIFIHWGVYSVPAFDSGYPIFVCGHGFRC